MPALSQDEFNRWVEADALHKERVLNHIADTQQRITKLETQQDECAKQAATRSTWVSSVVAAIVSSVTSAIFGSR